jgi:hypothetical protein
VLPALPLLTLTLTADSLAPRRLATFGLGDMVAMLFRIAHDAVSGNTLVKAAEQTLECLVRSSFNPGHFFFTPLCRWALDHSDNPSVWQQKRIWPLAPHN